MQICFFILYKYDDCCSSIIICVMEGDFCHASRPIAIPQMLMTGLKLSPLGLLRNVLTLHEKKNISFSSLQKMFNFKLVPNSLVSRNSEMFL